MMDDALLRPGRLEVQIEIGLPKEAGRTQVYSTVYYYFTLHHNISVRSWGSTCGR